MYRKSAKRPRTVVLDLTSRLRDVGFFGAAFLLLFMWGAFAITARRESHLSCTRDDAEHGSCEHVVRYVAYAAHERIRWDARSRTDVERLEAKSGLAYRARLHGVSGVIALDELTHDSATHQARADRVASFLADPGARTFEEDYPTDIEALLVVIVSMSSFGIVVVLATAWVFKRVRLTLSTIDETARVEQRSWQAWKVAHAVPLAEISGVRVEANKAILSTKERTMVLSSGSVRHGSPEKIVASIEGFLSS